MHTQGFQWEVQLEKCVNTLPDISSRRQIKGGEFSLDFLINTTAVPL